MGRPDFYPHPVSGIEERETHISKIFLTGRYVYKIKKPVDFGFLDFSSLEKRFHYCKREILLNRRLSNDVYLAVVPITFSHGRYCLEGEGTVVEYAVKMNQLPSMRCMSELLTAAKPAVKIDAGQMEKLSSMLAGFYRNASPAGGDSAFNLWENVKKNCDENFLQTEPFAGKLFERGKYQLIRNASESFLNRNRQLFTNRFNDGKAKDCHGDLRCEHVYFTDAGIQIIDCIEFNDRLRYLDVANDIAFLAMDLDYGGWRDLSDFLVDCYEKESGDLQAFLLLDFYKCYRAFVRCKVGCLRMQEEDVGGEEKKRLENEIARYVDLAESYAVRFSRPAVWVVCGMPASGKSTVAYELAGFLDAAVFSSDIIRKKLFGIRPYEFSSTGFEEGVYSKSAGALTYARLLALAGEEIEKGNAVVLDATFGSREDRRDVLRMASDKNVNVFFIECRASGDTMKKRLESRETSDCVSDARIDYYEEFVKRFEPLDDVPDRKHLVVDTEKPIGDCLRHILKWRPAESRMSS